MNPDPTLLRLQRAAAYAARGFGDHVDAGAFVATFSPHDDLCWINYAVPAADAAPPEQLRAAIEWLREEFARRRRKLRFEFVHELWPDLPAILESAGLVHQRSLPIMAVAPDQLRPFDLPGVTTELIPADAAQATLAEVVTVQRLALEPGRTAPLDAEIAEARRDLDTRALRLAGAYVAGRCVAAAALTPGADVAELTGVGTAAEFRGRGIARALSLFLVRRHFAGGGSAVWLSAANDTAARVYERIGFRVVGTQLHFMQNLSELQAG